METRTIPFELKNAADTGCEFTGHAAVFGNLDRAGDIVLHGAFKETLPQFLREGIIAWQHDWSAPIGRPIDVREDETGLYIHAAISDTTLGRDARTLLRDRVVKRLSIGFDVLEAERFSEASLKEHLGSEAFAAAPRELVRTALARGRALKRIELYEISPVSVPANPLAEIARVKSAEPLAPGWLDEAAALLGSPDCGEDWQPLDREAALDRLTVHYARISAEFARLARALLDRSGRVPGEAADMGKALAGLRAAALRRRAEWIRMGCRGL